MIGLCVRLKAIIDIGLYDFVRNLIYLKPKLMQQLLCAYDIPCRVIDIGLGIYCGQGSQAELQVLSKDQWTALLLLSTPE